MVPILKIYKKIIYNKTVKSAYNYRLNTYKCYDFAFLRFLFRPDLGHESRQHWLRPWVKATLTRPSWSSGRRMRDVSMLGTDRRSVGRSSSNATFILFRRTLAKPCLIKSWVYSLTSESLVVSASWWLNANITLFLLQLYICVLLSFTHASHHALQ